MSLGAALLQPYALTRDADDPVLGLVEDLARLAAIFIEDAAAEGPMAGEAQPALEEAGQTLTAWFTAAGPDGRRRFDKVADRLRTKFTPIRAFMDGLIGETGTKAADPAQILAMVRQLLTLARGAADAATLPRIRAELTFLKSLVEDDLGFGPGFIAERVAEYLTILRRRLGVLPDPADAAARRRLRLARATLGRLALRTDFLRPPDLDVEPLARLLHQLLQTSGLEKALKDVGCALDGVEAGLNAAIAAGEAVAVVAQPVGAGVVPLASSTEYSYFASWILTDEDVPLVGLSDLDTPETFLTTFKTSTNPVIAALRGQLTPAETTALNGFTSGAPDRDLQLTILSAVNREIQRGPILMLGGEQLLDEGTIPKAVKDLRQDFRKDQSLFLYNRRLLDHVFAGRINTLDSTDSNRWFGRFVLNLFLVPRNQVYVTGDRRFVMCDDKPMHSGTGVKWNDAPMFAGSIEGGMWFKFDVASPAFCEIWAQVFTIVGECGKAIWHLVAVQPGHEAQAATVGTIELADTVQQVLFGKPISAYFLEGNSHLRSWGKSLDSFWGLKGIATFASSFQGIQTNAPTEKFWFWVTVLLGDIFRTLGPIQLVNTLRDLHIGFVVLMNFGGPGDRPSTLPDNPAWNHRKQAPFVGFSDSLFAMALISLYPRDDYSINLWTKANIADRRTEAMAGHWLGGGVGLGLLAGLSGSFLAQFIAWAEDFPRFFITGGISAGKMFGLYWLFNYVFRENATDDGRYRPNGGSFRGYPDKDRVASPYRLPYPGGVALYLGQANQGLFSHNFISNTDFEDPTQNLEQQTYAYDFGHDFGDPIACVRDGVVWSFTEGTADSDDTNPDNRLVIRHATIDDEHDDFGNGPVQTFTVYAHLAQNGVTNAPLFAGTAPVQESVSPGLGTPVTQGDLIALAGDTGTSFHNHLHLHVVVAAQGGGPDSFPTTARPLVFTVPFVFNDTPGDGVLKSTTWYRSGNR